MSLLGKINNPDDLRKLSVDQLPEVCRQLREDIVREVSVNPGHLASSLGVVELTVALHYVYDTPEDRIVWDVGHQAYGHKILTGRRDKFSTNRKLHGIKPFPSPEESVYDTFECGHASNSISAALGMAVANKNEVDRGADRQRHVVAVIGDGAMSGGLAFEGLNNVSQYPNDTLIILNDNNMSIDRSVGGMKQYLLGLNTNETYNALKSAISHQQNIFEGLNIRYFGPFDGHNIKELVRILRQLKNLSGPKLLHLHTVKGKGYAPAEKTPQIWHAPGKFDVDTGERILEHKPGQPLKYQVVFGRTLLELAKQNPKIVGITPAMPSGCSLNIMMKEIPERTFDVGIAEGHAATFAGGMAKEGLVPFCNIYSAFAQRAYDNIIHDVAILNLHVVFCFDRAGLVGEDGPTHHGAFDIASLRPVPNLTICSPMDEWELRRLMFTAQLDGMGPWVIRYPRGCGVKEEWKCPLEKVEPGTGRKLKDGDDVAVLTLGPIGNDVAEAIAETEGSGKTTKTAAHYDMRFVKPLDEKLLDEIGRKFKVVVTVEDGARNGGFGSAVMEWLQDHGYHTMVKRIGLPDHFVEHGTIAELREIIGMDNASIVNTIYK